MAVGGRGRRARAGIVVEHLRGRSMAESAGAGTIVWSGEGDVDLSCGGCGVPLVVGATDTAEPRVFRCRSCGSLNALAP